MNNPLVSIIIPTYNKAELLKETLESVSAQSFQEWECLVIDDNSIDKNIVIATNFARIDSRFKIFNRAKITKIKGANACRNIGIKESKGKYLIFLDGDDWLLPHCIEQRVSYMISNPELDMAVFQMQIANDHREIILDSYLTKEKKDYLYAFLSYDLPWQTTGPIIKKEMATNVGGFDESFPRLQDPEFYTKVLLLNGLKFKVLPESKTDALYRVSENRVVNLSIFFRGIFLYITKFFPLIPLSSKYNKALQKSFVVAYQHINFEKRNININDSLFFFKLIFTVKKKKLITTKDFLKYTVYLLFYIFRINITELKKRYYKIRY